MQRRDTVVVYMIEIPVYRFFLLLYDCIGIELMGLSIMCMVGFLELFYLVVVDRYCWKSSGFFVFNTFHRS